MPPTPRGQKTHASDSTVARKRGRPLFRLLRPERRKSISFFGCAASPSTIAASTVSCRQLCCECLVRLPSSISRLHGGLRHGFVQRVGSILSQPCRPAQGDLLFPRLSHYARRGRGSEQWCSYLTCTRAMVIGSRHDRRCRIHRAFGSLLTEWDLKESGSSTPAIA